MIVLLIALLHTMAIVLYAIIPTAFYYQIATQKTTPTITAIKIHFTGIFTGIISRYDNLFFGLTFNIFSGKNRKNKEKNKKHKNYFSHGIPLSERILGEHKRTKISIKY